MKKHKSKKIKPVRAWAGVVDGVIPDWSAAHKKNLQPLSMSSFDIYKTREQARILYRRVIRVEIKPI